MKSNNDLHKKLEQILKQSEKDLEKARKELSETKKQTEELKERRHIYINGQYASTKELFNKTFRVDIDKAENKLLETAQNILNK
jgi:F0F1-type ATP synthase membrane subunit b/b'